VTRKLCWNLCLCAVLSLLPATLFAAPPIPVPPAAAPDRAQQNLQSEPERPEVGGAPVVTLPEQIPPKEAAPEGPTFKLTAIVLENATAFPKSELEAIYNDYIGTIVSLDALNDIASDITVHYRNAGYILSRAIIPPQHVVNGVVTIRIVEGVIDKVVFEGVPPTSDLLNEYAERIRSAKPLDEATLERYLLLINDLPGVHAQAVLRPSETPGASDVLITLSQKYADGSITADNRGSRYLGPYQGSITANANNAFGLYDRTQFHGVATAQSDEENFGQVSHEEQLDDDGTKLTLSGGRTRTNPGYKLKDFDVQGEDVTLAADISHPFIRSRQSNLYGDIDFDTRNTDTDELEQFQTGDRLRVLRAGGAYDFVDNFQATNKIQTQISKGFGWFDSSTPDTRSNLRGQTNFYKATAQASRQQPISGPFALYIAGTGQLSSDALLSAEQFGLGGAQFGSAYDPSEITGDSGAAGRVELQFTSATQANLGYQLYGFYDIGKVWVRDAAAGTKPEQSLADAGIGTRFMILEPLSASLELAFPLTRAVEANNTNGDGNDARVFLSLGYQY